tara:strand:+ start:138 stop:788 length:651 start_codon:yes stop_codon:yes gene_type:complete
MREAYFVNDHKYMIDLFSGLGGASEAFVNDDEWIVRRFDNNPLLEEIEYTHITDNMFLDAEKLCIFLCNGYGKQVDLIWASPPCTDFSSAYNAPKSKKSRGEKGFESWEPDFELLKSTIQFITLHQPKYWVIENVAGSIKMFEKYLGKPTQIIGSQVLWGNFPFIMLSPGFKKNKSDGDSWSSDPLRANKRAKVPYEISQGLKIAMEEQRTLWEWV